MVENYYRCECGKEFNNPQSFNGHKSHCIIHMEMNDKLQSLLETDTRRHSKTKETMRKYAEEKKKINLDVWIGEEHTCENCGKVMTIKFGSGRFCSSSCSRSHKHSEVTKKKISSSVKDSVTNNLGYRKSNYDSYILNPEYCVDCGCELSYQNRNKKRCPVCAKVHTKELRSEASKKTVTKFGGNINQYGVKGRCKYGTYNGISCDSSWELAFVYYCVSNGIPIVRNHEGFTYTFNGEEHTYYPDFIVNSNEIVEVKNYWTDEVQHKIDAIPASYNYTILYEDGIKKYIDFVVSREGKDFCEKLYDRTKPSFQDKKNNKVS